MLIPLNRILNTNPRTAEKVIDTYRPCRPELSCFLQNQAIMFEHRMLARTFLTFIGPLMVGYFSLGIKCTAFENADSRLRRHLSLRRDELTAPCHLIGQLSRSDDASPGTGELILNQAIFMCRQGALIEGGRAIRIDCRPELRQYYEKQGFEFIRMNASGQLCLMLYFLQEDPPAQAQPSSQVVN